MKVLHVTPWYEVSAQLGGVPVAVRNICRGLVEQGIDVDVFSTISDKEYLSLETPIHQEIDSYGVKVVYFRRKEWRGIPAFSTSLNRYLRKKICEYDLVHVHATRHWHGRVVASVCSRKNIPYVITPHAFMASWMMNGFGSPRIKKIYFKVFEQSIFTKSAAIHYTSEYERDESKNLLKNISSFVIPNGIAISKLEEREALRTKYREKLKIPSESRVLLYVGRIHPVKNLQLIIDGLAKLNDENTLFFCVGFIHDRNYFKELQSIVDKLVFSDNVKFIPPVENNLLHEWYLAADVFSLVSMGEGSSMALSEALSFGVPVIMSHGVSLGKEIVQEGCGRVIEADPHSCKEALIDLLANQAKCDTCSDNARRFAKKTFEQKNVSKQTVTAYQNILENKRSKELNWDDVNNNESV